MRLREQVPARRLKVGWPQVPPGERGRIGPAGGAVAGPPMTSAASFLGAQKQTRASALLLVTGPSVAAAAGAGARCPQKKFNAMAVGAMDSAYSVAHALGEFRDRHNSSGRGINSRTSKSTSAPDGSHSAARGVEHGSGQAVLAAGSFSAAGGAEHGSGLAVLAAGSFSAAGGVEHSSGLTVPAVGSRAAVADAERSSGLAASTVGSRAAVAGVEHGSGLAASTVGSRAAAADVERSSGLTVSTVGSRAAVAGVERSSGLTVLAVGFRTAAAAWNAARG